MLAIRNSGAMIMRGVAPLVVLAASSVPQIAQRVRRQLLVTVSEFKVRCLGTWQPRGCIPRYVQDRRYAFGDLVAPYAISVAGIP
eukprot:3938377-Rhodomonas_salina.6